MPYLNAKLSAPESAETTKTIAALLTDLTAGTLKKKRELTSIAVEYLSPALWFIGGADLASQEMATFYLDIMVTEGTNTKDEKALYIRQVFAGMEAVVGKLHPASYIVIHEFRADAWGYQGATQEYRYIHGRQL